MIIFMIFMILTILAKADMNDFTVSMKGYTLKGKSDYTRLQITLNLAKLNETEKLGVAQGTFMLQLRNKGGLPVTKETNNYEDLINQTICELEKAQNEVLIRVWSAPAAIALYGVIGWLIALERTKSVLILQFFMNGVNVLLDLWFVLGLNWGIEGVAIATVIAEVSALVLGLFLCLERFKDQSWPKFQVIFDIQRLKNMLSVNFDILLRSIMLEAIFVSFLLLGGNFGDAKLAANQVLLQFLHITAHGLDGFAFAAETLVGQAIGQKNRSRFRASVVASAKLALVLSLLMAVTFLLVGPSLIDLMTTAEDVRIEAKSYLFFVVLVPILGISAWMLDGIFIGATRTKDMRNMMAISLVFYVFSLIIFIPHFENTGLWLALLISFITRGITLGLRYPHLEKSI